MSFQGPGGGISGASNQFQCGYAQAAGNAGYAGYAGNADTTTYSYGGYLHAWAFTTNGNSAGVSGFQQLIGNTQGGNVTFNVGLGSYYGIITGFGQWQTAYTARAGSAGNAAGTSGFVCVG